MGHVILCAAPFVDVLSMVARTFHQGAQRARTAFLRDHPLCTGRACVENGRVTPATVVDHKTPHRGDMALFWDRSNWQSLCKTCHDRKTATEDGGFGRMRLAHPDRTR